ncbi:MAG: hypothetical protein ABSD29_18500 [Verrucomicrobiota bacterium]
MSQRHYNTSTIDALGRMIFPEIQPVMRRHHLRFLLLSMALGAMFCALFVWILLAL